MFRQYLQLKFLNLSLVFWLIIVLVIGLLGICFNWYEVPTGKTSPGISLVQQKDNRNTYNSPSSPGSIIVTLDSAAVAGNLLVTGVTIDKASGAITVPTGFTLIHKGEGGISSGAMAYKIASGGETVITWNWTATEEGLAWVGEYSGLVSSNVLDVSVENEAFLSTQTNSLSTGTTSATAQAEELAIAMFISDSGNSVGSVRSWTNGFTSLFEEPVPQESGNPFLNVASKLLFSVGAVESTLTHNGNDESYAVLATFKASRDVSISSADNQAFTVGNPTTAIQTITIADNYSTSTITAANDLRIKIPSTFNMIWDVSDALANIGGADWDHTPATLSGGEVPVMYEDGNKTVVIPINLDFEAGDEITVYGLSFTNFSAASSVDNLELETASDGSTAAIDNKTIVINYASLSFQDGVFPSVGYSGTRDTEIENGTNQNTNFGGAVNMEVDLQDSVTLSPEWNLLKWDVTAIPAGSVAQEATVTLNLSEVGGNVEFYELKRNWVESEATWNKYSITNSWESAGADGVNDRGTTVLGSISGAAIGFQVATLSPSGVALVQSWIDNPSVNYGFILRSASTDGTGLCSSEHATAINRPKLTIKYVADTTSPIISNLNPADNAIGIAVDTNLTLTFSEIVNAQSGINNDIVIKRASDNSTVETIDAQDFKVTGSGTSTITINPNTILSEQTAYYIQIGSEAFEDVSGNGFAGINDTTIWNFTTIDTANPTVSDITSVKTNGFYKTGEVINISVSFSEAVTSVGDVTVTLETGTIDRICVFTIINSAVGSCNYTVQAGDTSADLDVTISGIIADQVGNPMINFTPTTTLAINKDLVIDTSPPLISLTSPINASSLVNPTPTFDWSGSDAPAGISSYALYINGSLVTSGAGTSYTSLSTLCGANLWYVIATDRAGNAATSATYYFTVSCGGGGGGAPMAITYAPPISDGSETNLPYYLDVTLIAEFADGSRATVTIPRYSIGEMYDLAWSQVVEAEAFNGVAYVLSIIGTVTGRPIVRLTVPATVILSNLNLLTDVSNLSPFYFDGSWNQIFGAILDPLTDTVRFSVSAPIHAALFNISMPSLEVRDENLTVESSEDPNIIGAYDPALARAVTQTIDTNMNIPAAPEGQVLYCTPGTLLKAYNFETVYYCGRDGRRYVFPSQRIFYSWYADFSNLVEISISDLARIPIGDNITYRPGVRMIKLETDPKVYAVARGSLLRWIMTEAIARILYGLDWHTFVDDIPILFWGDYHVGDPITPADVDL